MNRMADRIDQRVARVFAHNCTFAVKQQSDLCLRRRSSFFKIIVTPKYSHVSVISFWPNYYELPGSFAARTVTRTADIILGSRNNIVAECCVK